jgi:RNA polymerase sigma-70 factor (ECF subfamily)
MDAYERFRVLFQDAYPALQRYALYRGLTPQDADDLAADTLEIAWRRLSDVPADDPLPWLYAVARNVLRNQRRKERRRGMVFRRLRAGGEPADLVASSVTEAAALRKALAELNRDDRELLTLVAWDGLSPAQAAVVIGCSATAVRTRLHRARNRLAARLGFDPRSGPGIPLQRSRKSGQAQVRDSNPADEGGGM